MLVFASLVAFAFVVLRGIGPWAATAGAARLAALGDAVLAGALAIAIVFGIGSHILVMGANAVRRRILDQHVLVEAGALEWLSLIVKTRSMQAVQRLLDLRPDTARVVESDGEHGRPVARCGDRRPNPHPSGRSHSRRWRSR